MGLKELVEKSKAVHTAEAAGESFSFKELSQKEEFESDTKAKLAFENYQKKLDVNRDEFIAQYRAFYQLKLAGEDIDEDDFFSLGAIYVGEISLAINEKTREVHPEYFKTVEELEKKNLERYTSMFEKLQQTPELQGVLADAAAAQNKKE